jgi:hypothetical protein
MMQDGPAAYNKGDADAFCSMLDEKTIIGFAGSAVARADRLTAYEDFFAKNEGVHYEHEEIGLDFITPDVAIFRTKNEYTGLIGAEGKANLPQKPLELSVLSKRMASG